MRRPGRAPPRWLPDTPYCRPTSRSWANRRTRNGLQLGSGLEVAGNPASTLPVGSYARAVVTVVTDRTGRLGIEDVSLEGRPTSSRGSSQGVDIGNSRNIPADAQGPGPTPRDTHPGSGSSRRDSSPGDARGRDGPSGNRSDGSSNNSNGNGGGNQGGGRGGSGGGDGRGNGGGDGGGGRR